MLDKPTVKATLGCMSALLSAGQAQTISLRLVLHPLISRWSATAECIVATIATIPPACVLVYLGSRGGRALGSVGMVALLLSLANLWIAYKAFL
ncbi:MAG: hypothetical protein ACYTAO_08060 [Planctomycetota bacterium]|jgi:hypothetical protein